MNSLDVKIGYSVDRDVDSLDFKLEVGLGRPVYFGGVKTRIRARRIKAATDMSFLYLGIFFFFIQQEKAELLLRMRCCIFVSCFRSLHSGLVQIFFDRDRVKRL